MYKATAILADGTGGALPNPHQYATGRGVAFSKSPKRAVELALDRAYNDQAFHAIPVFRQVRLERNGRLISVSD